MTRSFNPQLPLQAGKCGRFGALWQSTHPPPSPASCLPAGPADASLPGRQRRESPSTHLLLAKGKEKSRAEGAAPVTTARPGGRQAPALSTAVLQAPSKLADRGSPQRRGQQERWPVGAAVPAGLYHHRCPGLFHTSLLPPTQPESQAFEPAAIGTKPQ